MQQVAQSWLIYQLTGSVFLVGLNGLFGAIPFVFMTLYAGVIIDRVDRKKLLIVQAVLSTMVSLVIGLLIFADLIQVWHIYAASVAHSLLGAFESPGRQAILPSLVPRQDLMTAVSLNSIQRKGAQIIGPALGGLFVASFGVAGTYFINVASHTVLIWCLAAMQVKHEPLVEQRRQGTVQAIFEGLRYVRNEPVIGALILMEATMSLFGSYTSMMVVFAKDFFDAGPEGLGLLQSAAGAGSVAGSVGLGAAADVRHKGRLLMISGVIYGASLIAFASTSSFGLALVILAVVGASDIVFGASRITMLNLRTRSEMLGRVMSLSSISMRGLGHFGSFQLGATASLIGLPQAVALGGAICIAMTVGAGLRVPEVRSFTDSGRPRRERDAATEDITVGSASSGPRATR